MWLQRVCMAGVASVLTVAALAATPPDLFDEIYVKSRPMEATLRTLTARFTETTTSSLLTRGLRARGTLAVVRPSRIVLQYDQPERRTLLIDGGRMRLVWPSRAIDRTTDVGATERRIRQYFVDKSPAQLRSHFDIAARDADDRPGAWLVQLTPKRSRVRQGIMRLDLWIARNAIQLAAMRMTFPDGDTKLMEFDEVRVNPPIDPALFEPVR